MQHQSLPDVSLKTMLTNKFGSRESFLVKFNPKSQRVICKDEDNCFFGDFPTLATINEGYGQNAAFAWLVPQLYNLSEYCGCKDKLQGEPLEECADVIAMDFYWLKISELMLFFHRFKSGRYGRFYGSVDPLVITTSLREFLKERNDTYFRHEQENAYRKESSMPGTVSWEEYCDKKGIEGRKTISERLTTTIDKEQVKEASKESREDIYNMAQSLLMENDKNVLEAFDRVFKKKYGCTMKQYIKKYHSDAAKVTKG